jgi:monofunctional biosynthetic peptidoglycan transglycosylase
MEAIRKAQRYNARHGGRKVKGASTISQQTAKNVFLWPSRTWVRKGLEVYFTFLIEVCWSKRRILEVYLNVIETGDGLYGAEAAAQRYFKKPASKVSNAEAALLAACLPNPLKWSPARPTSYLRKKQQWILRHMGAVPADYTSK